MTSPSEAADARPRRRVARSPRGRWLAGSRSGCCSSRSSLVVWEGAKALGGDPWRFTDPSGDGDRSTGRRSSGRSRATCPCRTSGTIAEALAAPVQRQQAQSLAAVPRRRCDPHRPARRRSGSCSAALLGLALAAVFVHSKLAERAFMPYVVASQTIPILALAPLIAFAFGNGLVGHRDRRLVPDLLPGDDRRRSAA